MKICFSCIVINQGQIQEDLENKEGLLGLSGDMLHKKILKV